MNKAIKVILIIALILAVIVLFLVILKLLGVLVIPSGSNTVASSGNKVTNSNGDFISRKTTYPNSVKAAVDDFGDSIAGLASLGDNPSDKEVGEATGDFISSYINLILSIADTQ